MMSWKWKIIIHWNREKIDDSESQLEEWGRCVGDTAGLDSFKGGTGSFSFWFGDF